MKKLKIIGVSAVLLLMQAAVVLEKVLMLAFVVLLVMKGVTYFDATIVPEPSWLLVFSPVLVSLCLAVVAFFGTQRMLKAQR